MTDQTALDPWAPENALTLFTELVENNDQAMPMLLTEDGDGKLGVYALSVPPELGMPGVLQAVMPEVQKHHPNRVMLSSEAWVRIFDPKTREEIGMEEGVLIVCTSTSGPEWWLQRPFVRTQDGVRWLSEPDVQTQLPGGELPPLLRQMVGRS